MNYHVPATKKNYLLLIYPNYYCGQLMQLLSCDPQSLNNTEKIKLYFQIETAIEDLSGKEDSSELISQLVERKNVIKLKPRNAIKGFVGTIHTFVRAASALCFVVLFAFWLFLPTLTIFNLFDRAIFVLTKRKNFIYNILRAVNSGGFLWMLGIKLTAVFDMKNPPANSHVLFFTHGSNLDAFMFMYSYPHAFKSVGKDSLFSLPFIGWLAYIHGLLPINRKNRGHCFIIFLVLNFVTGDAIKQLAQASESVKSGSVLALSPEGTRSPSGMLLPFKKGMFFYHL